MVSLLISTGVEHPGGRGRPPSSCWRRAGKERGRTRPRTVDHPSSVFVGLLVWVCLGSLFSAARSAAAGPVEFSFHLSATAQNPFARDVWADVIMPNGKILRSPAFYVGGDTFAVRARVGEVGKYEISTITEKIPGKPDVALTLNPASPDAVKVAARQTLPQIGLNPADPVRFVQMGSGKSYTPIGANLAWAGEEPVKFYERTLPAFASAGLNWTRIWMASWGGLNPDWLPEYFGDSPAPGHLDLRVALAWDKIVAQAEESGVYFQFVLQHHGQYSTKVNPNWAQNPWNAANPRGFLKEPGDFFTDARAREITRLKYRYIVARWGYSPAILAWELFNEVHWVDAIGLDHDEDKVARWHSEMADYLRSVDGYDHLVTTSTESLLSPIYAGMDYFQPHLYPYDILSGPLSFNVPYEKITRPIFFGETGDDHAPLGEEQKKSGIAIVPPVWASLMGRGRYPAQPWTGEQLFQVNRLGELAAVARFLGATDLGARAGLTPFSPRVECVEQVPLVIEAGQVWQRRPAPDFVLPLDGRVPLELADIPRAYAGASKSLAEGWPGRVAFHFESAQAINLRARLTGIAATGSAIRISADEKSLVEKSWLAGAADAPRADQPVELTCRVPAGAKTLVVENPGGADWFQLDQIATDVPVPVIAAIGKRSKNFFAVWLWHRTGVFALTSPAPVGGTLLLDEVPPGKWTVTWWDTIGGIPSSPQIISHDSGVLRLPIPALNRHAAVVLTR